MHMKKIILLPLFLVAVIFVSGCTQTGQIIKKEYVCPDDRIVDNPNLCSSGTEQEIKPINSGQEATIQPVNTTIALVSRVIDGDTIELNTGERVRLLGINTPEKGQPYKQEATDRLKQLVENKVVALEKDVNDRDQYNRLLRHVYVDGVFVNLQLIKEGYASVYVVPPNKKHEAEFRSAWSDCLKNKANLCTPSNEYCDNRCIGVAFLKSNAEGDDCSNLNGEYVVFKNSCSYTCELTGWTAKDDANHIYTFPNFALGEEESVTLYTGDGINTETKLYWKSSGKACNAIWNNNVDTLYLRDAKGNLVLNYSYNSQPN